MKKALFLDRDGVLNVDTGYLHKVEDLQWIKGAKEALKMAVDAGYELIVVTNQSGIARGYYTEQDVQALHEHMGNELAAIGAPVRAFYYCPHHVEGTVKEYTQECNCRKPLPGMIEQAINDWHIDPYMSFMVGDRESDMEAAQRAGVRGYLFDGDNLAEFMTPILGWEELRKDL